ncbi:MAG TPA: hypothetical protein VKR58_05645, partial [Aquella sp.]|nr:hypothetical protein [Aquella sp.]
GVTGAFNTFTDVINAIPDNSASGECATATVYILPGTYMLQPSDLSNHKQINFIGTSYGGIPAICVTGSSTSYGNKNWYSVRFVGPQVPALNPSAGIYTMENVQPNIFIEDDFDNCTIESNFQFIINNQFLTFEHCYFYNAPLLRQGIITVNNTAYYDCTDCEFYFENGTGSTVNYLIGMFAGVDANNFNSIFDDCQITGNSSSMPMSIFAFNANSAQLLTFNSSYINVANFNSQFIYYFGPANPLAPGFANVQLMVSNSQFVGAGNQGTLNCVLGNLYSNNNAALSNLQPIILSGLTINNMTLLDYTNPPVGLNFAKLIISDILLNAAAQSAAPISINLLSSEQLKMTMQSVSILSQVNFNFPVMRVTAVGGVSVPVVLN